MTKLNQDDKMAFALEIDIKGHEEIKRMLDQTKKELVKEAYWELLRGSYDEILPKAKAYAPFETGILRESIKVSGGTGAIEDRKIEIFTDVDYGFWMEFGFWMTKKHLAAMAAKGILRPEKGMKPGYSFWVTGSNYPHWVQNPFMKPAIDESVPAIKAKLEGKLKEKLG